MKIILATNNKGKVSQFRKLFKPLEEKGVTFATLKDIGYTKEIIEDGTTYEENSLIKARQVCNDTGYITISEDSGLSVDALNGRPGIYTARYISETATKLKKLTALLQELKDVKDKDRGAKFISVITIHYPDGRYYQTRGECKGTILKDIVNLEGGMAFTPIFKADGDTKALSELSEDELIQVNHRGIASKNFIKQALQLLQL